MRGCGGAGAAQQGGGVLQCLAGGAADDLRDLRIGDGLCQVGVPHGAAEPEGIAARNGLDEQFGQGRQRLQGVGALLVGLGRALHHGSAARMNQVLLGVEVVLDPPH